MVPMDQPAAALDLITRFTEDKDLADSSSSSSSKAQGSLSLPTAQKVQVS